MGVGNDQHVRFWSRRQLHETLVHRLDADLALRRTPAASPATAAHAVDEFLGNVAPSARFSPKAKNLRGDGGRAGVPGGGPGPRVDDNLRRAWLSRGARGGTSHASAWLTAGLDLLLVLYGRLPATGSRVSVAGDSSLVHFWLANSALG